MAWFSLSTRISLVVACLWAMLILTVGLLLYKEIHHELWEEVESDLYRALETLESSCKIENGTLSLKLNTKTHLDAWKITTQEGRLLWTSPSVSDDVLKESLIKTETLCIGNEPLPLAGQSLIETIQTDGSLAYRLPTPNAQITLQIQGHISTAHITAELNRLTFALWSVGPLVCILFFIVMTLFIRWQLSPLRKIAQHASEIRPENIARLIPPAGSSTECVRLRDALNRMLQRLAQGLERERNFSSCAAHEMRTPLAQLRTQIEVGLRKPRTAERYKEILEKCFLDVERLEKLIVNLLLLSREAHDIDRTHVSSLKKILIDAVQSSGFENLLLHSPINSCTLNVIGNAELLTSAFRNVLDNARKYSGTTPTLEIRNADGIIHVEIADTGVGIPLGDRERIFDPLVRLDLARSIRTEPDGFGLGLSIARMSVRSSGGDLTCAARSDGKSGAVFIFRLCAGL